MVSEFSFGTILAALHVTSMLITHTHVCVLCIYIYMHVFMYVCMLKEKLKAYGETLLTVRWDDNYGGDVPLHQHTLW